MKKFGNEGVCPFVNARLHQELSDSGSRQKLLLLPYPQILRIMRMLSFMLLALSLQVSATGFSQKISISGKELSVTRVLDLVKIQSGYVSMYNLDLIEKFTPIDIAVEEMPLMQFLQLVFKGQAITFRVDDNTIFLSEREEAKKLNTYLTPIQLLNTISGRVIDSSGNPVSGASIQLLPGKTGTSTADDGTFSIPNVKEDKHLRIVVSGIGLAKKTIPITDLSTFIIVKMEAEVDVMDDMVITGYGKIRKESFTGSYTQIGKEDLKKVTANNLIKALQVFDPSFRIKENIATGSNPNALPDFYIRGQSGFPAVKDLDQIENVDLSAFGLSNNPNTPIFILDGFEVSMQQVYDMDINRINSVTILKDAAATAMYGSRASNGVIVIETIVPKAGKFTIDYTGDYRFITPDLSSYNLMNAEEKLLVEEMAGIAIPTLAINDPNYFFTLIGNEDAQQTKRNDVNKGVNTYWLSQPLNARFNNKHSINIGGGEKAIRFGLNLGLDNGNGVMKGSYRNRTNAALNLMYNTSALQLKNQVSVEFVKSAESPYGSFSEYVNLQPYYNLRNEETGALIERYPLYYGSTNKNPLHEASVGNFSHSTNRIFTNNFSANWFISNSISLRSNFAVTSSESSLDNFTSPESTTFTQSDLFTRGSLNSSQNKQTRLESSIFGQVSKSIDRHYYNVTFGLNGSSATTDNVGSRYEGFPNKELNTPGFAYKILQKPTFADNTRRLIGGFLNINYSFKEIFLFDASFRMDGSSEFGTEKKYAPFWSLGAGINLHNTKWFENNSLISLFRVTANVGETGKANFAPYMAKNTYNIQFDDWYPSGIGANIVYLGNDKLAWEKQISTNISANIVLANRYTVRASYYNKLTYDLITDVSLPSSSGFKLYKDNVGKIRNNGFEIDLSAMVIQNKNFSLSIGANMAQNNNRIMEIAQSLKNYNDRVAKYYDGYRVEKVPSLLFYNANSKYASPISKYEEGGSMSSIFGMRSLGINPANGKEVFLKRDGTITYQWDANDNQIIGNSEARGDGSINFNVRYKRWSMFNSFRFQFGADKYNLTLVNNVENANLANSNADRRVLTERWLKPGDVTTLKAIQDRLMFTRPTSRFIQEDNQMTFSSLSLEYQADTKKLGLSNISNLRFSLLMSDIGTISSIKREVGTSYPFERSFTLSIKASL